MTDTPSWKREERLRPRLCIKGDGFIYYGGARLELRVVDGRFEFLIKEPWYRQRLGKKVYVDPEELVTLIRGVDYGSDL